MLKLRKRGSKANNIRGPLRNAVLPQPYCLSWTPPIRGDDKLLSGGDQHGTVGKDGLGGRGRGEESDDEGRGRGDDDVG